MTQRVVLLSAFATPFRSGAEACVEEVAARLQDRYDITIVTARLRHDLPEEDVLASGVRVLRVGRGNRHDKWRFPLFGAACAMRLRPQLVHAVLESYAGLALVRCQRLVPGVPRILTLQSTNTRFLLGPIHRAAHHVTAISSALVRRATSFGVDAELIPNGISLEALQEARRHHRRIFGRILFVGRLERVKGVDTLLRTFALVSRQHGGVHLRVVGDGSQRSALERLAAHLGVHHNVTFVGSVPPEMVPVEMAQAEIFCGLSRSEAFGNVFLEAQAAGCAVVATDVGGIPDIVRHGHTGLLVQPDDPFATAHAIFRLLDTDDARSAMVRDAMQHASSYDWAGIAERYAAVYDRFLRSHPVP